MYDKLSGPGHSANVKDTQPPRSEDYGQLKVNNSFETASYMILPVSEH